MLIAACNPMLCPNLGLQAAVCFFISSSLVVKGETYASKQQLLVEIIITAIMGYAALFGHWMFCKYPQGESGVESARAVAKDDGVQYSQAIVQNGPSVPLL